MIMNLLIKCTAAAYKHKLIGWRERERKRQTEYTRKKIRDRKQTTFKRTAKL